MIRQLGAPLRNLSHNKHVRPERTRNRKHDLSAGNRTMPESMQWRMPSNCGYAEAVFCVVNPQRRHDEITFCVNLKKVYSPGAVPEGYTSAKVDVVEYEVTLACV